MGMVFPDGRQHRLHQLAPSSGLRSTEPDGHPKLKEGLVGNPASLKMDRENPGVLGELAFTGPRRQENPIASRNLDLFSPCRQHHLPLK